MQLGKVAIAYISENDYMETSEKLMRSRFPTITPGTSQQSRVFVFSTSTQVEVLKGTATAKTCGKVDEFVTTKKSSSKATSVAVEFRLGSATDYLGHSTNKME